MDNSGIRINVAVISDLHVGSGAKSMDFSVGGNSNAGIDDYLEQFQRFVSQEGLRADYLLVPGDISNSACREEFELASENIKKIASMLHVEEERILFCPGNHDVDWRSVEALKGLNYDEEEIIRGKYVNFHSDGLIFKKNMPSGEGRFDVAPYLVSWEFDDALVCSLNSAVFDSPDNKPHHGEVKPDQLRQIEEILESKSKTKKIKIFIFHHHPKQYLDSTFPSPDFSAMTNAEGLLDVLSKYAFDFVVHGHKHIPRFTMQIQTVGHPLWILCAGSFSAHQENKYYEGVGNNFHLVEFHDRCVTSDYARGVVKSWTHYSGPGWMQSRTKGSFDAQHYFGAFLSRPELKAKIKASLEKALKLDSYVEWKSFICEYQDLKYFTNEMLRASLKDLAGELNIKLHEIDNFNLDQLVILKR